ncbi:nitroreductase family protein [bacterium]|nr:nitroreductase family protein [bacterium]
MLNKEKPVEVVINKEKCKKCGRCIDVCGNYLKKDSEGFPCAKEKNETLLGCIQCGNCMMTCDNDAIDVVGQDVDKEHLRPLNNNIASFEQFDNLLLKRRSIRKYKDEAVSQDVINKIITTASKAPVSIPPSEVKVLVINGKEKVQCLADDIVDVTEKTLKALNSPLAKVAGSALNIIKPYMYKTLNDFMIPMCKDIIAKRKDGEDILFYNSPAIIIFYGTPLASDADILIAATYANLAAEAMGLGTCFNGSVAEIFERDLKLKHKYGIFREEHVGIAFTLGYPDVTYTKSIQRDFKEVRIEE